MYVSLRLCVYALKKNIFYCIFFENLTEIVRRIFKMRFINVFRKLI